MWNLTRKFDSTNRAAERPLPVTIVVEKELKTPRV